MDSKEVNDIELNILVFGFNPQFKKTYEEGFQSISKIYPNIHYYIIINNFEEELQKIKDIKLDIVCSFPFVKNVELALKMFPTIKWVHSLSAGIEKFLKVDLISKNEKLLFSNSKGA